MSKIEKARELGIECADDAYAADGGAGNIEVTGPMAGDWVYLIDQVGQATEDEDVCDAFADAYEARLEELIDAAYKARFEELID